jgi:hypothetical protein
MKYPLYAVYARLVPPNRTRCEMVSVLASSVVDRVASPLITQH